MRKTLNIFDIQMVFLERCQAHFSEASAWRLHVHVTTSVAYNFSCVTSRCRDITYIGKNTRNTMTLYSLDVPFHYVLFHFSFFLFFRFFFVCSNWNFSHWNLNTWLHLLNLSRYLSRYLSSLNNEMEAPTLIPFPVPFFILLRPSLERMPNCEQIKGFFFYILFRINMNSDDISVTSLIHP